MSDTTNIPVETGQYYKWSKALATHSPVPFEPGKPSAGCYKVRDRNEDRSVRWDAVWIYYDEQGIGCLRTGPRKAPTHPDEIEALFASCNSTPITHELYLIIAAGGDWPEDVAHVAPAPVELPPHEAAAHELAEQQKAAKEWLLGLRDDAGKNRKPDTQAEADKAANYGDEFAKIGKRADKARVDEKEPHLAAGREVDAKWKATIESAEIAKKWAKSLSDDYAKRESARRTEEARVANEKAQAEYIVAKALADQQAKRDAELAAKGVVVPQFAPVATPEPPKVIVAEPVKVGTGSKRQSLRKFDSYEVEDAGKLLVFLAGRNLKSVKLLEVALSDGRALAEIGVEVPGLKLVSEERMV